MKMQDYSIYCTKSQTRRAYKLGAPIMTFGYGDLGEDKDEILSFNKQVELSTNEDDGIIVGQIPTAEQMVGWLRKDMLVDCLNGINTITTYDAYKQSLLNAIDAALYYLEKRK